MKRLLIRMKSFFYEKEKSVMESNIYSEYYAYTDKQYKWNKLFTGSSREKLSSIEYMKNQLDEVALYDIQMLRNVFGNIHILMKDVDKFSLFGVDANKLLLCIASVNLSGYIREKALNLLSRCNDEYCFAFILWRCADWVDSVRQKALKIVEIYVAENRLFLFLKYENILRKLDLKRLSNLKEIKSAVEYLVQHNEYDGEKIKELNDLSRLFYYRIYLKRAFIEERVSNDILNDNFYKIRCLLIENKEKLNTTLEAWSKLISDKAASVRKLCLYNLPDTYPKEKLKNLLLDRSNEIRVYTRKLLSNELTEPYRNYYIQSFLNNARPANAIVGIGETGTKTDVKFLKEVYENSSSLIAAKALHAIFLLDEDLGVKITLDDFGKFDGLLLSVAKRILIKHPVNIFSLRKEYNLFSPKAKQTYLHLLNRRKAWSCLGDFLRALKDQDLEDKLRLHFYIKNWFNYTRNFGQRIREEDKTFIYHELFGNKEVNEDERKEINFIFKF